eukprot:scaffold4929_cov176-Amphora_coffeaeformis.AAC.16
MTTKGIRRTGRGFGRLLPLKSFSTVTFIVLVLQILFLASIPYRVGLVSIRVPYSYRRRYKEGKSIDPSLRLADRFLSDRLIHPSVAGIQ